MSTTGSSSDIEHNKNVGQVSRIFRTLTNEDGDLLSHFDEIDESQAEINITSLKHNLVNNHDGGANKGKIKGHLPLVNIFGICRTFKKTTQQLVFHLTLRTADVQDTIYLTLGVDIKLNFDKMFLFVPIIIVDAQTQIMFIVSIKISFTLSIDPCSTDRKTVDTHLEYQVDIGSAQNFNCPKYLIVAHQTAERIGVQNKTKNIAVFDSLIVWKDLVDIDGVGYP